MIALRAYQTRAIAEIRSAVASGSRAVLAVSPTGSGKTTIASEIVRRSVENGRRVLWLAHRSELVEQAYDRLESFGLSVGVIAASPTRPVNPFHPVQVAMIQTLVARSQRPEADVIIWDEAHHAPSDEWSVLARDYAKARLIGFTATPERSDGRGLGNVYDRIVVVAHVDELVEQQHLVPASIHRPRNRLRSGQIAQRPVDAYSKHAAGRRAIVFSPSVLAANAHAEEFIAAGIAAEVVHGNTPYDERVLKLRKFRSGDLKVLINVYVLTEGFDAPETDCVILARGCGTAGIYIQMVGRGLRPAAGKTDCIVLDLHGVSHTHGKPEDRRRYSLDGKGIRTGTDEEVDKTPSCRVCGAPVDPGEACPDCGTAPNTIDLPKVANVDLVPYAYKRAENASRRASTLARWIRDATARGYKPGFVRAKYRAVYGEHWTPEIEAEARAILGRTAAKPTSSSRSSSQTSLRHSSDQA